MKHNIIIDGSNLMYSGVSKNEEDYLNNGLYVGGVTSILRSIGKLRYRLDPDNIYITFDKYKSKYRLELFPQYKSHRVLPPDIAYRVSFNPIAIDILESLLPLLGVVILEYPNVEGDDVISNFVKQSKNHNTIISTDKDYLQLINENCSVYRQVNDEFISLENVDDYFGFNHQLFLYTKALKGDKSDNINGADLIGDKRAISILNVAGKEKENIIQYCSTLKTNWAKNTIDFINLGLYERNIKLMDLNNSPYIDIKKIIKTNYFDIEKAYLLLTELQFNDIIFGNDWKWLLDWSNELNDKQQKSSK
jgi:DNA polymerase-1